MNIAVLENKKKTIHTFIMIISYWTGLISSLDGDWYRCNEKIFSLLSPLVILRLKSFFYQLRLLLLPRLRRGHQRSLNKRRNKRQ